MEQNKNKSQNADDSKMCNSYDDGNIPDTDLPNGEDSAKPEPSVEPLPESTRPRQDGPGGD